MLHPLASDWPAITLLASLSLGPLKEKVPKIISAQTVKYGKNRMQFNDETHRYLHVYGNEGMEVVLRL
jgi:hypothetical protein